MKSLNNQNLFLKFISLLIVVLLISSCDDLLTVEDPGSIELNDLSSPENEELILNGVYSEFQYAFDYMTLTASILSDEIYTDHTNIDHRELALFNFDESNVLNSNTYTFLHKARVIAEDAAEQIASFHENPNNNLNVAEAYAYAGYTNLLIGEHFCESPIDDGPALPSNEILERALDMFDQALTIAGNANQASSSERSSQILNLANLGSARASLQMGEFSNAISFASTVPDDFEAFVYRSSNSSRESNIMAAQWITTQPWASVDPRFQNLNDPRVRHISDPVPGLNAQDVYLPYRPYFYQGWDRNNDTQTIDLSTGIRFASGLEARYIEAEANGPTSETLAFVNERREFGGQGTVSLSGEEIMEELREQRSRDFYMAVQRHGDLRRYLDLYDIDLFPSGSYPITDENYGDARCFIIPLSEINGNPNL